MEPTHIEIVRRPAGAAPEWVRDAWIGLSLPLAEATRKRRRTVSILEPRRNTVAWLWMMLAGRTERIDGYIVDAKDAIDILGTHDRRAANWWRTHVPGLLDGREGFVFDAPCCEVCGE